MNNKEIKEAILTLEVLIDECKEDGTYYTAQKEWEALEVFKQLQNNWNELKKWLEEEKGQWGKDNSCWFESALEKIQELENRKV